jgi:hypothetical protein
MSEEVVTAMGAGVLLLNLAPTEARCYVPID